MTFGYGREANNPYGIMYDMLMNFVEREGRINIWKGQMKIVI